MAITIKTQTPAEKKEHKELVAVMMKFGFGEPDLRLRRDRMERSMKRPVNEVEASLSLLEEILSSADSVQEKVSLFFGMAEIFHLTGKDPSPPLSAMHKTELSTFKEIGFRMVRVEASKDACPECKKLSGKVVAIEDALKGGVLPHRACKHDVRKGTGLCRCRFLAEFG
ncbi:MAG TPA: hypothetical protein VGK23_06695 [Methanomassiliicoccales archaeon]|jgi:hypothetical protein